MGGIIFLIIIVAIIGSLNSTTHSTSNYSSTSSSYKVTPTYSSTTNSLNKKSQYTPSSISVSPRSISSKPSIKLSLIDGQYRIFENHYVNGVQYTFGFPKYGCKDRRVWVGIDKMEIERISMAEANRRIKQKHYVGYTNNTRSIGYSSSYGYCNRCNKKLRGDRSKKNCYACWKSGYR